MEQIQPHKVRVDLGLMAMEYSIFLKAPRFIFHHRWFSAIIRILLGVSYASAEMQSAYSTDPSDDHYYEISRLSFLA